MRAVRPGCLLALLLGTSCIPLNRNNPVDPASGTGARPTPTPMGIDDCEDMDRTTSQGPNFFWRVRRDQELVFQGSSTAQPLDSSGPYMTGAGYASAASLRVWGNLGLELFPSGTLANPYYGFVQIEADLLDKAEGRTSVNYMIKADPSGQDLSLTLGVLAKDGDFFSWQETIPPAGLPAWVSRAFSLSTAQAEANNFHRVLGRNSEAPWPGPEPGDLILLRWLIYTEGSSYGANVPFSIYIDDVEIR